MKINQAGLDLIKTFEGLKLKAYKDIGGIWTCGYGTTGDDVGPTTVWTQEYAEKRLIEHVEMCCHVVSRLINPVELSSNQWSALVCFAYNVGTGALQRSTLLRKIYSHEPWTEIAKEFLKWDKVDGVEVDGLLRRRKAEAALFLRP